MLIISKSETFVKWEEKKLLSKSVAQKMAQAGFEKRAAAVSMCSEIVDVGMCPKCGKVHVTRASLCRDRFCPVCQWRLAIKRMSEMLAVIEKIKPVFQTHKASMITLTVKNVDPADIRDTLQTMTKSWSRLTKRAIWKKNVIGWARSIEITYNAKNGTLHPHMHIIVIWGKDINADGLRNQIQLDWKESAKLDYFPIVDVRDAYAKTKDGQNTFSAAVVESFKYALKSKQTQDMPLSAYRCLVDGVKSIRFVGYGGIIKAARAELNYTSDDEPMENEFTVECPVCSIPYIHAVATWSGVKYEVDTAGVVAAVKGG